jgi:hypothetical protein
VDSSSISDSTTNSAYLSPDLISTTTTDTVSAASDHKQPNEAKAIVNKIDGEAVAVQATPAQRPRMGISPPVGLTVCIDMPAGKIYLNPKN